MSRPDSSDCWMCPNMGTLFISSNVPNSISPMSSDSPPIEFPWHYGIIVLGPWHGCILFIYLPKLLSILYRNCVFPFSQEKQNCIYLMVLFFDVVPIFSRKKWKTSTLPHPSSVVYAKFSPGLLSNPIFHTTRSAEWPSM
jgi:hypothetical protein